MKLKARCQKAYQRLPDQAKNFLAVLTLFGLFFTMGFFTCYSWFQSDLRRIDELDRSELAIRKLNRFLESNEAFWDSLDRVSGDVEEFRDSAEMLNVSVRSLNKVHAEAMNRYRSSVGLKPKAIPADGLYDPLEFNEDVLRKYFETRGRR